MAAICRLSTGTGSTPTGTSLARIIRPEDWIRKQLRLIYNAREMLATIDPMVFDKDVEVWIVRGRRTNA